MKQAKITMAAEMPLYDFLLFVFLVPILLNYLIVIDFVAIKQIYTWQFLTIPLLDEAGGCDVVCAFENTHPLILSSRGETITLSY